MLRIQNLSDSNKKVLLNSLPIISKELDLFVIKFYSYFLKTGAGKLFHSTQLEKQSKMFHTSLGVIISHIEHPEFLEKHLESIMQLISSMELPTNISPK
jgi:hemoglobin-like flavoprotein